MNFNQADAYKQPEKMSQSITGKKRLQLIGIHILCWIIFLSIPAFFNERIENLGVGSVLRDILYIPPRLVFSIYFIVLFYFSYYVIIPAYYFTARYWKLAFYYGATFAIFIGISYAMQPPWPEGIHRGNHMPGPSFNLFMYIITCILSFALCLYTKWRKLYEENLNTEISFLKAQINPHFLFNTLNSIYSLALAQSEATPDAVVKLSGIMRYAVSDSNQKYVSLEKEIAYIYDYIELQKLRLHPDVLLAYTITGDTKGKQLAPFMLIPFIEKAFKYGVNAEEESSISIIIKIEEKTVLLEVNNLKVTVKNNENSHAGLGIDNTRQRLQLLYPGKHKLDIFDTNTNFKVLLKIDIA